MTFGASVMKSRLTPHAARVTLETHRGHSSRDSLSSPAIRTYSPPLEAAGTLHGRISVPAPQLRLPRAQTSKTDNAG